MNTGTRKMQARMIKRKKEFAFKPTLSMIGMVSTALHMKLIIVLAFSYPSTLTLSVVAMLMFPMAFLFGALLLQSLRRFKGAGIELEPAPFIPETIKFGPSLDFFEEISSCIITSTPAHVYMTGIAGTISVSTG